MNRELYTHDLLALDMSAIAKLDLHRVAPNTVTPEVVTHFFRQAEAYWQHDGDLSKPHAELTSGNCSDGFVDVLRLLRYTPVCELFARELVYALLFHGNDHSTYSSVDWVVGSDHAGAGISHSVACRLRAQHDFTEKADCGNVKRQVWKRHQIPAGQKILQVEELITTFATLEAVRRGLNEGNLEPVDYADAILTVVNRSGQTHFGGSPILSLVDFDIKVWQPDKCPLCAAGSPRLKPKKNWAALTQ